MKKKKTLILIVGETGVGKDTVVSKLPYHKIVSYTTRPMRKGEDSGLNHIFITNSYMNEIEHDDNVIAWTQTGDIRYCATADQIKEDISIYIVNPDGIRWFKENYKGPELNVIVIGLYLPLEIRRSRCKVRSDFNTSFEDRVSAEQKDFELFRLNGEFDYLIRNEDSVKTAALILYIIEMSKIINKNTNTIKNITYDGNGKIVDQEIFSESDQPVYNYYSGEWEPNIKK